MKLILTCNIPGRPYLKKTTARFVGSGRFKRVLYSQQYVRWEQTALAWLKHAKHDHGLLNAFHGHVWFRCQFNFENHQAEPDLSALFEGVADACQKAEIIVNDKFIHSWDGSRKTFGGAPFTKVEIFEFDK